MSENANEDQQQESNIITSPNPITKDPNLTSHNSESQEGSWNLVTKGNKKGITIQQQEQLHPATDRKMAMIPILMGAITEKRTKILAK